MIPDYHSALRATGDYPKVSEFVGDRGIAFQHDLAKGFPARMLAADVLYSDLPWRDGYTKFHTRAGVTPAEPYYELLGRVANAIRSVGRPAVMITGRHACATLKPDSIADATLNSDGVFACLWGMPAWTGRRDAKEILRRLAVQYQCVGDFCCGYGRAGWTFSGHKKRYILSDINASCIGYIAEHAKEWG